MINAGWYQNLADLRAKLTYLLPIMAPDMLDRWHVEYLTAIRDDADRLCREGEISVVMTEGDQASDNGVEV
ncbi:hypothetical protein MKK70_24940 [Methylobacterium sp. E-041]|uniref:hypothetical protein n=1 Tax=Methylobacterium sp. E-041 TaxID=2836573 RepID=UPI001FBAF6B4|nr:hypothetical protein [Methylobacterium sp. E-041]MCJ2108557.1 hypothetical protein [Methylobacterium sp. E-041]